jgi:hypothetical protein
MSRSVHVELAGSRACSELVDFLAVRGLAAELVETNDRCELEIGYALDPDRRLHGDVASALRSWLAEQRTPLVLSEAGDDAYVLRPAGE